MQLDTVMSQGNNICLLIDMSGRREKEMRGRKEKSKHILIGFVKEHVTSKAI